MDKKIAIKIISNAAKEYEEYFKNKDYCFFYYHNKIIKEIIINFRESNFIHLTGISVLNKKSDFYRMILAKKIKETDFELKKDGTTTLKLEVINHLKNIISSPTEIGDYQDFLKINLKTDKLIGNKNLMLGIKKRDSNSAIPQTLLSQKKESLNQLTSSLSTVLLVISKQHNESEYKTITYISKKFPITNFYFSLNINNLIPINFKEELQKYYFNKILQPIIKK